MGDEGLEPPKRSRAAELQSAPFAARVNHPILAEFTALRGIRRLSQNTCSSPGAAVLETIQQRQELRSQGRALRLVDVGEAGHDPDEISASLPTVKQINQTAAGLARLVEATLIPSLAGARGSGERALPRASRCHIRGGEMEPVFVTAKSECENVGCWARSGAIRANSDH